MKWKGSICGIGPLFEQIWVSPKSKVPLNIGVSLISFLACAELCANQLQTDVDIPTLCTGTVITRFYVRYFRYRFLGDPYCSVPGTFQTSSEPPLLVCQREF